MTNKFIVDAASRTKDTDSATLQSPELSKLWQTQRQESIDLKKLTALARSQTRKQRLYMVLDVLSLFPFLLFFFIEIKLTPFLKVFIVANLLAGMLLVAYFIKLRWQAAFARYSSTSEFSTGVLQQLKNSARIAQINKHLGWIAALLASLGLGIHYYLSNTLIDNFWQKLLWIGGFWIVFLIPWTLWTHARQRRFEQEIADFSAMIADN